MPKPLSGTYPPYFERYVKQVPEDDLIAALQNQLPAMLQFLESLPEDKYEYAYAPDKWTIKEVLQHVIDTERIFNYRALSFARGEQASLPGFEENDYAKNSFANERHWQDMVDEFNALRQSTLSLYKSFNAQTLAVSGKANDKNATVLSMGFITAGHSQHHKKIIEERYLN